jgi:hypothetical protein
MSTKRIVFLAFAIGVAVEAGFAVALRQGWPIPYCVQWGHNPLGWWIGAPIAEWMVHIGFYYSVNTVSLWFDVVVAVTFGAQLSLLTVGVQALRRQWQQRRRV